MKLYVGNLDASTDNAELEKLFAQHGAVQSAVVVTDKFSGASRGFGFVEMSDADGSTAMKALDGQQHRHNTLRVNEARPQSGGGRTSGAPKRFGGGGRDGRGGWRGR